MKQMPVESLLGGVGQAGFGGDAAHLALGQSPDRKHRLHDLRLCEPVQEVALVLACIQPAQQLHLP